MKWLKTKLVGLVIIWLTFSAPPVVAVAPRFEILADITYKIAATGKTTVIQNFYLTNLTSEYAPDEYIARLAISDPTNVRAFDGAGDLSVVFKGENLHIKLPSTVAGAGHTFSWTLVYDTAMVAAREGRFWVVRTAKPAPVEGLVGSSVNLEVPPAFGREIYRSDNRRVYDPRSLPDPYQAFDFKISYQLYNPKFYPVTANVYLPPDATSQKVFLDSLTPRPVNVSIDGNGNWVAAYQLGPAGKLEIRAAGSLALFGRPVFAPVVTSLAVLSANRKTVGITGNKLANWTTDQNDYDHIALIFDQDKFYQPEIDFWPVDKDLDFSLIPKVGLRVDIPKQLIAGFPSTATVFVENYGPTSYAGHVVNLLPATLKIREPGLAAGPLAPFSTQALNFTILPTAWNRTGSDIIRLEFAQEKRSYRIDVIPFYKNGFILTVGILVSLGIISIVAQIARSLLFPKQKR